MKKRIISAFLAFAVCGSLLPATAFAAAKEDLPAVSAAQAEPYAEAAAPAARQTLNFNKNWRFEKGENKEAGKKDFDDSSWRKLNLPHDYSIENDFNYDSPSSDGGGYLDGGPAWYRKTCVLPADMAGKRISVDFEGVYMNSKVYVNGTLLGEYPYGYSPFSYDITDYVVADGMTENVIAVYTNNVQPSSRWYSGSGIYRDVTMTVTEPVHVARYGVYVKTPNVAEEYTSNKPVTVGIDTKVENETDAAATVAVRHTAYYKGNLNGGASDTAVATKTTESFAVAPGATEEVSTALSIADPQLWELGVGGLYELKTEVLVNGAVTDTCNTDYGLRWTDFTKDGFYLNGEYTKMRGVCQHHDQGALGAVNNQAALDRQIRILRESGVNSIRSSHNPASRALLNACNEQGIMVMDEAFDTWYAGKNKNDFHLFFDKPCTHPDAEPGQTWPEFDLKNMIEGAKNDPSIIIWSIGNEIGETWDAKGRDTGWQLAEWVREIDPIENNGRAVTLADPFPNGANYNPADNSYHWQLVNNNDVTGFNYGTYATYDQVHAYNPDWFIYSSETASAVSTRGEYFHPEKEHWCEMPLTDPAHKGSRQCSEFDNDHVSWGTTMNYALKEDIQRKYMGGVFFWTGFDYIGEPSPSKPYQAKSSYFGFVDTCGFPKDSFYMLQSQWLNAETDPMVHIFPHWNWENDDSILIDGKMPLRVYSNAASVEVFLNGDSLGKKSFVKEPETDTSLAWQHDGADEKNLYLQWLVDYEPGTVEAVAYDAAGNEIARDVKKTAGDPAALRLTPERSVITADGEDLAYIAVDVVDENGVMNPDADNNIQFSISGNGRIVGTDNGNPMDLTNMKSENRSAFNGKAMVIVQSTTNSGSFTLTATSAGLPVSSATVYTRASESGDSGEILGYDSVSVKTAAGVQPALPATVTARYADGTKDEKAVTWDEVSDAGLAQAGYITVNGTVGETGAAVTASVLVVAPVGVQPVSAVTASGVQPTLPETVKLVSSDGTAAEVPVTWDEIDGGELTDGNTFTVEGALSDSALKATAHIRVSNLTTEKNWALASNGGTFEAYVNEANYDPLSTINDYIISYDTTPKNGWGNWAGMGEPIHETEPLTCTIAEERTLDSVVIHFREDGGIYIPSDTLIQYWDGAEWADVQNQSARSGFRTNEGSEITFDPVTTDKLRATFTRGTQDTSGGKKDCVVITEFQIFEDVPDAGSPTAALEALTVDGEEVEDFDPDKTIYTVSLPFGAEIPAVAAVGADYATVLVLPAVSNNSAATVRVTSEDGQTARDYTVQFVEAPAAIDRAELRLEKDGAAVAEVVEDDVVTIHVDATLEDGTTIDPDLLDIKYALSDAGTPAKAEVKDGQLYAYKEGTVTLTAEIGYLGEKTSASREVGITPTENKKTILSYSPVSVTTKLGAAPVLPGAVKAKFDLGLAQDVAVIWDTIDPSQYARYGSFTVSGTVAGQALRPTATVLVCAPVAAENQSMATPVGIAPALPETVKVYSSDGTSTYSDVVWDEYDHEQLKSVGDISITGAATLGGLPVSLALRVTDENVIPSDNHALLRTGFKYSLAFADFSEGSYDASALNNGKTGDKWCSYGVSAGNQQHIGVVFGADNPGSRYVDTVKLYMLSDTALSRTGVRECTVQYYKPAFGIDEAPANPSNMLKEPAHPLNNEENWADVENQRQITDPPANTAQDGIFVIGENALTFDMVDTYALRLKITTMGPNGATNYLALGELEAFGKRAALNRDFTVSSIEVNGAPLANFDPATKAYTASIPGTDVPAVTATATGNASVTVLPAPNIDGETKLIVTSEDGLKTETYAISFESSDVARYNVNVVGGVAYRTPVTRSALANEIVEKYAEGEKVTVIADASPDFKAFDKWVSADLELTEEAAAQSTMTFAMPGNDVTLTATYTDRTLTDAELVAQAKQKIGSAIEIPYAAYADEAAQADAATGEVQALLDNGVTAAVRYETDHFVLTLSKGEAGATVSPFTVTIADKPNQGGGSSGGGTPPRPSVSVPGTGGTATADSSGSVTVKPDEGYRISKITVNGKEVAIPANGRLTGLKPTDKIVVTFEKIPAQAENGFTDVSGHWAKDAIQFVTEKGLFSGTSATTFSPDATMTRAMLMTVLARMDGQDTAGGATWYEKGMNWAKAEGISDGTNPEGSITREQLATMLYRYAGSPEIAGMVMGEFADADQISAYAKNAMLWATQQGIITGRTDGRLDPAGSATRAEVATMLQRYLTKS